MRFPFSPSGTLWVRCLANTRGHPHQPGPCAVLLHQVRGHGTPRGRRLLHPQRPSPPCPAPRGPSPVVWHLSPRESPLQPEPPATLPRVLVSTPQMLGPGSFELLRSQRLLLTLSSPNVCPHLSFPFCALSHLLTRLPPLPSPSAAPAWPPPPAASVFLALGCAS